MRELQWRNSPPDSQGFWAFGKLDSSGSVRYDSEKKVLHPVIASGNSEHEATHFWCKLCDLPDIAQPPSEFREPTQDDVGQMVDVKLGGDWKDRRLLLVVPGSDKPYIFETDDGWDCCRIARIQVNSKNAEKKPVEIWVNEYETGHPLAHRFGYPCESADAAEKSRGTRRIRTIHFREVV